jgi:hypothetical protein
MEVTYDPDERADATEANLARSREATPLRDQGLEALAEDVRRHHKAVERHLRAGLGEAIAAGEALVDAKGLLRHGEFGPWLTYCGINQRTAQLYMKLAREKRNVAVLEADSIRGALEALGGKPKPESRPKSWDWFFEGPDRPLCYLPVYTRSLALEQAERVLREQLRLCIGMRDGRLVAQLRRRDLGDPSVEHDFGPLYSCSEALREGLPADELLALRDLVDAALRERGEAP